MKKFWGQWRMGVRVGVGRGGRSTRGGRRRGGLREREEVERGGDREGSAREGCVTVVRGDAFLALETMWGRGWVYAAGHCILLGSEGGDRAARESSLVLLAASLRWRAFAAIRHDASERASERAGAQCKWRGERGVLYYVRGERGWTSGSRHARRANAAGRCGSSRLALGGAVKCCGCCSCVPVSACTKGLVRGGCAGVLWRPRMVISSRRGGSWWLWASAPEHAGGLMGLPTL